MNNEAWYERYAWIWFVVVAVVGLVFAVRMFIDPASGTDVMSGFGFDVPAVIETDAAATSYMETAFELAAIQTLGLDFLALMIAVTAFRKGERWAWIAFWYWPAMFLSHFITYESSFQYAQLAWLVISVAVLAATYRKFWRPVADDALGQTPPQRSEARP